MIKVAICDDDIQFIYKLEQSIFRFAEMKRIKVDVDGYTSGAEFIQKLQQSERYDLLFLDIELGDSSGIIVGNWIRSQIQYESMQIVFVSAKEMYAMQLFDLRPMNFLVKPIQQERVDYILDEYERLYQFQATSTTIPPPSCPSTAGKTPSGSSPDSVNASVWQTPVWVILISTSPFFGGATSISTIFSGWPGPNATAARDFIGLPFLSGVWVYFR